MSIKHKFFIDQHGCAKNQVDGEIIISHLTNKNYVQTFEPQEADLIIVNSCGFIESAKKESINAVLNAKKLYPDAKIILTGCLAQRYADELKDSLEEADGIFGNGDLSKISDIVQKVMNGKKSSFVSPQNGVCVAERKMLLNFKGTAFVKITEGCNNRCSFCSIPLIRGELRSRDANEIIEEIKTLISNGIYEINLIGQDLAAYGTGKEDNVFGTGRTYLPKGTPGDIDEEVEKGQSGLCSLLKMISAIKGTFRLRLLYIHPDHFNEDILEVIKNDERILPYFDIPFQSGDDSVILKMNRVGSAKKYKSLIKQIRTVLPQAAIRTTFLAGFPGESEEAFENTKKFLSSIKVDWSGCFAYSREDDTPAYSFKHRVPKKIAQQRVDELISLQAKITQANLKKRCGKDYDILIEEVLQNSDNNSDEGIAIGRAWFQAPEVDGSVVVRFDCSNEKEKQAVQTGRIVKAHICSSGQVDLTADFVSDSPLNKTIEKNSLQFAQDF